jgi:hypothetical protein
MTTKIYESDDNDESTKTVFKLCDRITDAIDEFARDRRPPLEVGEVLSALFTVLITSAQSSPGYDRDGFVSAFTHSLISATTDHEPRAFDA